MSRACAFLGSVSERSNAPASIYAVGQKKTPPARWLSRVTRRLRPNRDREYCQHYDREHDQRSHDQRT